MFAKSLLIGLTVLAVLTFSVQGLVAGGHAMGKHHRGRHMAEVFATTISHKAMSYFAQHDAAAAAPGPQIPQQVIDDFTAFAMKDPQIMKGFTSGTLSPKAIENIKGFFLKNKAFNDAMVQSFDNDPTFPQCYKDLKPNQKSQFIQIIIQNMDFGAILNGSSEEYQPSDADIQKIKTAIDSDKQLGPDVTKCLGNSIEMPKI